MYVHLYMCVHMYACVYVYLTMSTWECKLHSGQNKVFISFNKNGIVTANI